MVTSFRTKQRRSSAHQFDIRGNAALALEDLLSDAWRLSYLRRFAEAELSSENVEFMMRVREFESALTDAPRARELGQDIYERHIKAGAAEEMAVTSRLRNQLKQALADWLSGTSTSAEVSVKQLLAILYQTVYRNVSFDVIPRFLASAHCHEMAKLHPARALLHEPSRAVYERILGENR